MKEDKMALASRTTRRQWMLDCTGLIALSAAGCGRADRMRATKSALTILYYGDERILGPYYNSPPQFLVFLPLVTRNAKGELEGRLAQSWEHSPDYRTCTIHLRTDVKWQDGVPVTAHDVKFTLDLLSHPKVLVAPPGTFSVTVLDDNTYTITYHKRASALGVESPGAGSPLDDWTVYYPKHLLEKLDAKNFYDWDFWTHPVGDGPYKYVRQMANTMMELEANPDYFRGKPKIERVVLKFGDPSLTELLSGNVDAMPYTDPKDLLKMSHDPRFTVYYTIMPANTKAILWNQRHPLFRDPKVRRALTLAINRRELHQVVNLPETVPIFDVIPSERQFQRGELPVPLPYDYELAKRLLDEAGWGDTDREGVRQHNGKPFRFTTLVTPMQGMDKAAVYIQAQLRRVGVNMDIATLELEAARNRVKAGAFEAAIFITFSLLDVPFGEQSFFGEGSHIGYNNPKVTALLNEIQATLNPDKEDQIYRELWPIFQADLPVTYLYPAVFATVAHRRVHGLSSPYRTDPTEHMEDLWLED